jgi:hypothetical protein
LDQTQIENYFKRKIKGSIDFDNQTPRYVNKYFGKKKFILTATYFYNKNVSFQWNFERESFQLFKVAHYL